MSPSRQGIAYGVLAYFLWGLLPLYFKLLAGSGTLEITVHRYLWAVPTCALVILATGQGRQLGAVLRTPRRVGRLGIAAVALAATSVVYIYAVTSGQLVQASLGYFINPLASVALAVVVLGERLRRAQWVAVGIGLSAVLVISVDYGRPLVDRPDARLLLRYLRAGEEAGWRQRQRGRGAHGGGSPAVPCGGDRPCRPGGDRA